MTNGAGSSDNVLKDRCVCVECGRSYMVEDADSAGSENYFAHPCDYAKGRATHCLMCWLGCGPRSGFAPPPP